MPLTRARTKQSGLTGLSVFGSLAVTLALLAAAAYVWQEGNPAVTDDIALTRPTGEELAKVARTRILFGHQSVGANIISGLEAVYAETDTPGLRVVDDPERGSAGGFLAHTYVGVNGDPLGKIADFTRLVEGPHGEDVDVALLKLCYLDIDASTDIDAIFGAYAAAIGDLEQRHPDIRFLYATVPLTADRGFKGRIKALVGGDRQMGPADNVARQRYNALVRERFQGTGRLFDIAAVEATFDSAPTLREHNGEAYYVLSEALRSDRGHLNEIGSQAAAMELIRVVAATTPVA